MWGGSARRVCTRALSAAQSPPLCARAFSAVPSGPLGKKELGDEKNFAQRRDAELLRKLAAAPPLPAASPAAPSAAAASNSAAFGQPILPFHHAFPVHNLAAARAFYRDLLGCEEGRSSKTWIVRCQRGGGAAFNCRCRYC